MQYLARDIIDFPAYQRHLTAETEKWENQAELFEYAPAYPSTLGRLRSRALWRILPEGRSPDSVVGWAWYLHGGAWALGRAHRFLCAASPWIEQGWGVIMPEYRRLPRYSLPDMLFDFGLAQVYCSLAKWCFSYQPTMVAGISSGGHLAASLALRPKIWTHSGWNPPVAALCCAAPLSLGHSPGRFYLNRLGDGAIEIDPLQLLQDDPPAVVPEFMIVQPELDVMVPSRQAEIFFEQLKTVSPNSQFHRLTKKTHLGAGQWMFADRETRQLISHFIERHSPK